MTQPANPTQQHAYTNGADAKDIETRARDAAASAKDAIENTAAQAKDAGEKALADAKDAGEKALVDAKNSFEGFQQDAVAAVRKNPGASLVGAIGIGVLIGMALRGRD